MKKECYIFYSTHKDRNGDNIYMDSTVVEFLLFSLFKKVKSVNGAILESILFECQPDIVIELSMELGLYR